MSGRRRRSENFESAKTGTDTLPDDLYIEPAPWPRIGRPPKLDFATWTVTDDWPEEVPVTNVEVDVFEAWFGDIFDQLFGPCR